VREFRQACALAPIRAAVGNFHEGDPVPSVFNRHATAHAAGWTQYTPANTLIAVMLGVSLTRELQGGVLQARIHA